MNRELSEEEYATLAEQYEKMPPELSGHPGFITELRQRALVNELLDPNFARIVNAKAKAMSVSPSTVIQSALEIQLAEAV